jgi:hypothetical protein
MKCMHIKILAFSLPLINYLESFKLKEKNVLDINFHFFLQ